MWMDLSNSLKTKMDYNIRHMFVHCTRKKMHERFTFNHPESVFILNNGYTSPFKNNNVEGRIVFPYNNGNASIYHDSMWIKEYNERLSQLSERRRTVLKPRFETAVNNYIDRSLNFLTSTPIADSRLRRDNFINRRFRKWNHRPSRPKVCSVSPTIYRPKRRFPYKWRRSPISKAQLDDEIDEYMAEARSKAKLRTNSGDK